MGNMMHVEASKVIDARAEVLYDVVTDYRAGHPAILPKQYFTELIVEQGGRGAGTVVRGSVKVWGAEYPFHQQVSEPEPGRVLKETDTETGQVTTFTFDPLNSSTQTRVTIASEFPSSPGLMGWMERLIKPGVTRKIYEQELQQLAEYVRSLVHPSFL